MDIHTSEKRNSEVNIKINLPVGRHYRDMPGHSQSDIRFTPFEKLKSKDPFVRKARESEINNKFDLLTFGRNRYL